MLDNSISRVEALEDEIMRLKAERDKHWSLAVALFSALPGAITADEIRAAAEAARDRLTSAEARITKLILAGDALYRYAVLDGDVPTHHRPMLGAWEEAKRG
jgi:hypothetical protein